MAEVYANLIRRGRKTIEQVPERLREEVKAILAADGNYATLIVKGKKTLDQVPALIRKQVEEILKDLEVEVE